MVWGAGKFSLHSPPPLRSSIACMVLCSLNNHNLLYIVFPQGSRTSPGAFGAVPEILPAEVLKVSVLLEQFPLINIIGIHCVHVRVVQVCH